METMERRSQSNCSGLFNYVTERKRLTSEQRRLYKFKKKYDFQPESKYIGTINVNGRRQKINLDTFHNKEIITNIGDDNAQISMDRSSFKMKPKRTAALLNHELGHAKMHYTRSTSKVGDKRFGNEKYIRTRGEQYRGNDLEKFILSKYDRGYLLQSYKVDPEFKKKHEDIYNYMNKKYTDYSHNVDPLEIEADRYAANQVGKANVKRGLRNYNKLMRKNDKNKDQSKAVEIRSKALDDPKIASSDIYK